MILSLLTSPAEYTHFAHRIHLGSFYFAQRLRSTIFARDSGAALRWTHQPPLMADGRSRSRRYKAQGEVEASVAGDSKKCVRSREIGLELIHRDAAEHGDTSGDIAATYDHRVAYLLNTTVHRAQRGGERNCAWSAEPHLDLPPAP